jgi:hypothetical protein
MFERSQTVLALDHVVYVLYLYFLTYNCLWKVSCSYGRTAEYTARGKISLSRGIHCCPNFFISFARPASLHCEESVYIYTYTTAYRLYMNCRCYHITLRAQHFYTNWEGCEVLTGYLSPGCRPGGDWGNTWHRAKRFTVFFSNRK